tara:strand:+ start:229 stop:378 length:150 start_codon:yes stop_codon:yes gene_type:complete
VKAGTEYSIAEMTARGKEITAKNAVLSGDMYNIPRKLQCRALGNHKTKT